METGSGQQPHKRRKRYSGKYPRAFDEKYKEHNPEKYSGDIEKIIESGKTPAGMHIPICVDEILEILDIKPGETGMDATLGYGGHTAKMLEKLGGCGHIYATDLDPIESAKTTERLRKKGYGEDLLTVRHMNFSEIDKVPLKGEKFDFVLADLGVSSMQIDNPERGFTFKHDGPLDLRLDPTCGETAAQRLSKMERDEIEGMLEENADEPYAFEIANEIYSAGQNGRWPETTGQLRKIVSAALSFLPKKDREEAVKKSCQRTFQALRIDVNSEYESLYAFLEKLPCALARGGRVAILTFHSGEDRLVKAAFKQGLKDGVYSDAAREVIRPTPQECRKNPRARSAKLRWAVKA